jgi:hypothetical protein
MRWPPATIWQPVADLMEEEVEEAQECTQTLEDMSASHQGRLDGMFKKFTETCHNIVNQQHLDLFSG